MRLQKTADRVRQRRVGQHASVTFNISVAAVILGFIIWWVVFRD